MTAPPDPAALGPAQPVASGRGPTGEPPATGGIPALAGPPPTAGPRPITGPQPTTGCQPASGPQPTGLPESIARLRRALRRAARVADPANELAVAQLELLACLAEHPGARPGQLARLLYLRPNTVTTLVNALTGMGMIQRSAPDGDRRSVALHITGTGQHAVLAWQATNTAVLNLALASLSPPQRDALARSAGALDALARAIEGLAEGPANSRSAQPSTASF